MSNYENRNKKPMTPQELLEGITKPNIPIDPFGALYRERSSTLSGMIVDMFVNTFKIVETDHILMYPISDKAGRVRDFGLSIFFDTRRGGQNWGIRKLNTNQKSSHYSAGGADLRGILGNRMSDGGFELSDQFKKVFAPIAEKNDDGNIIIETDPNYNFVGVIRCDFFEVIGLCLGIVPSDNYDFAIVDCKGMNVDSNGLASDYLLTFTKEISLNNAHRRGKNGIDYSRADTRIMKNANR